MQTLLVTGAAGFIGSHFVRYWLRQHPDDRIAVLDALTYAGNLSTIRDLLDNSRVRFYPGRIQDRVTVRGVLEREQPAAVVNFAAESHNDRSALDPDGVISTNVTGVGVLLDEARQAGVERVVHVSTDEVYGEITSGLFRETDPLLPRTLYSAAKAGGELQARAYHIGFGMDVRISRGSNTFGPYQYPEKLLPFFITRALQDKKLPLYGAGDQVRDWIHAEDHAAGIAAVLERGAAGETYNLGGGNERTNLEVTRRMLAILGKPESLVKPISDPRGAAHDVRYALDTSKAQRELSWQPVSSFDAAFEETVLWFVRNESWWGPIVRSADYREFVAGYYGKYLGKDL